MVILTKICFIRFQLNYISSHKNPHKIKTKINVKYHVIKISRSTGQTFLIIRSSFSSHWTDFWRLFLLIRLHFFLSFLSQILIGVDTVCSFSDSIFFFFFDDLSCRFKQKLNINCEFDWISSWTTSQVIHSCLQTFFPCIEMNRAHFSIIWFSKMNV